MSTEEEKQLVRFHNRECPVKINWTPDWPEWVVGAPTINYRTEDVYDAIGTARAIAKALVNI